LGFGKEANKNLVLEQSRKTLNAQLSILLFPSILQLYSVISVISTKDRDIPKN
jgi:hypothetical protein